MFLYCVLRKEKKKCGGKSIVVLLWGKTEENCPGKGAKYVTKLNPLFLLTILLGLLYFILLGLLILLGFTFILLGFSDLLGLLIIVLSIHYAHDDEKVLTKCFVCLLSFHISLLLFLIRMLCWTTGVNVCEASCHTQGSGLRSLLG